MSYKYIFEIKVRPGEEKEFIKHWHNGSAPIQQCAGALGTRLYKKQEESNTYIAIAEWESKNARKAAFTELNKKDNIRGQEMRKWGNNEDFGEVTIIGGFDEIDNVLPSKVY